MACRLNYFPPFRVGVSSSMETVPSSMETVPTPMETVPTPSETVPSPIETVLLPLETLQSAIATTGVIPFTLPPLLQVPPASRGEPRRGSVPPARRGNLKEADKSTMVQHGVSEAGAIFPAHARGQRGLLPSPPLSPLIRVHRLGSLCAKCAHFLPSPPAPLPRCGRGVSRARTCLEC